MSLQSKPLDIYNSPSFAFFCFLNRAAGTKHVSGPSRPPLSVRKLTGTTGHCVPLGEEQKHVQNWKICKTER